MGSLKHKGEAEWWGDRRSVHEMSKVLVEGGKMLKKGKADGKRSFCEIFHCELS